MSGFTKLLITTGLVSKAAADCYMHNPRGSNNRLNEKSANRNNGNRLFDSQNNNRGGYNVGDLKSSAFDPNSNADQTGSLYPGAFDKDQYSEMFYEESELTVEWTNQHGCGGNEGDDPHKLNCNMVLQYTCNNEKHYLDKPGMALGMEVEIKNGRNTNTPDSAGSVSDVANQKLQNDNNRRGRHEGEGYYYECQKRSRNKGLFLADQKLKGNAAQYTRQNPNGNRRGLECPEERDYYPYWAPSPWVDIAYLTSNVEDCGKSVPGAFDVLGNSQNNNQIGKCVTTERSNNNLAAAQLLPITESECTEAGGAWETTSHKVKPPHCGPSDWSRVNHLGNGRHGQPVTYNWTLPKAENSYTGLAEMCDIRGGAAKIVLRMRYNISTDDYDVRLTNSSSNEDLHNGVFSPIENNPTVDIGADTLQGLRLAINTNQFGRTFQDRSHAFYLKKRPANQQWAGKRMYNLNVRGKRGNIVQTFPSVEYDFVPNNLHVVAGDLVHVQWTGSNTHNNGNPAGDGQAGDAGEGTGGTDRHNIACTVDASTNFPIPIDTANAKLKSACLFHAIDCWAPYENLEDGKNPVHADTIGKLEKNDCAVYLGTSGYYKSVAHANGEAGTPKDDLSVLLNNAPASLDGGVVISPKTVGRYNYMATRNNNFSNRSQKGLLSVYSSTSGVPSSTQMLNNRNVA